MSIRKALEELLLIVEIHQKDTKNNFAWAEVEYAKELLAQPEQEPVAINENTSDGYHTFKELYLAPPKREPLSYEATSDMFLASNQALIARCYWAGIRDAEKAHGIGGEE